MNGASIEQLAPNLIKLLKPARKYASVATTLQKNEWARAFQGNFSVVALVEYLQVWERVQGFTV
jgi:hypothetical protein